jgi:hypothetical protein
VDQRISASPFFQCQGSCTKYIFRISNRFRYPEKGTPVHTGTCQDAQSHKSEPLLPSTSFNSSARLILLLYSCLVSITLIPASHPPRTLPLSYNNLKLYLTFSNPHTVSRVCCDSHSEWLPITSGKSSDPPRPLPPLSRITLHWIDK